MRFFRLIIAFIALLPLSVLAQNGHNEKKIKEALVMLDSVIANKKTYQTIRKVRADSIEQQVNTCPPEEYVEMCQKLYWELYDTDGNRALKVLERIEKTDEYDSNINLKAWVLLNKSQIYGTMGLYHKANAITNEIDPSPLSKEARLLYYRTCFSNYQKIEEYTSHLQTDDSTYYSRIQAYADSILILHPEGFSKDITFATREMSQKNLSKALYIAMRYLGKADGSNYLYLRSTLASTYELLQDSTNSIYYLAVTAAEDIKNGVTDYQALPYLVQLLHEQGDNDHAYKYLICTMEDANIYPSRSLALEISRNFPVINREYNEQQEQIAHSNKLKRDSLSLIFTLLALAIGAAFYIGWRHNNNAEEKKRADALQTALDQANIADRIKNVFIQNMRHEIRTPLNAIMGFAQLMSNDLPQEERDLYNEYIMESNNQLLSTLDDIIDVSNMEVGTFNFHFEDTDIDQLCQDKMEETKDFLPQGVQYIYHSSEEGLKLYTDKRRVGQVLQNLLSNACKNTTNGSITLQVEHDSSNNVQFIVTDTGVGIPADKAKKIFEHFEKLDHYSPGLGLGLYVCNLIAQALGGDIYLDTSYTEGARFVFTVPSHSNTKESESKLADNHIPS